MIILLFGHYAALKAARKNGYKVINIQLKEMIGNKDLSNKVINEAFQTYILDNATQIEDVVKQIIITNKVVGVLSFTDRHNGVLIANELNNKYIFNNKFTPNDSVGIINDKGRLREFIREKKLKSIPYRVCKNPIEVIEFLKQCNTSIILKPTKGQGSNNVVKVSSECEVKEYFSVNENIGEVIAELFLEGREFSVESITYNYTTKILAVTEKLTIGENIHGANPFVELSHTIPAKIEDTFRYEMETQVKLLFDMLGVVHAAGHTEFIVGKEGPYIIESHLRPGGDSIPKLVELYRGCDIHSLVYDCFYNKSIPENFCYLKKACVYFFIPPLGKITYIEIPENIKNREDVHLVDVRFKEGDWVNKISNTVDRKYGHIIVTSNLDQGVIEKTKDYINSIIIKTDIKVN